MGARVKRQIALTEAYGRVPNGYLPYYYDREASVADALAARQTRAEAILEELPACTATSRRRRAPRRRA